jgi:[protein-PII] uridylyltransferase
MPASRSRRRFRRATEPALTPEAVTVDLGDEMVEIDGEVALAATAVVSEDASLAFRLAATAAELDRPIARGSLHRLADRMPPPADPWPPEVLTALVRLLATGRPAIKAMESLDQHGLVVRLIPEWAAVRNKPQRNAYHTFTVDRHLLEAAARAAALVDRVERPDLLLIGALLHDIGKGFPGDHTDVGMEIVGTIGLRMGFSPTDVTVLVDMVRYHLLLPDTATRRDLDDPTTITNVARAAGDPVTLHLLGALTEADSLATGPSAWGGWKAGLVADLVLRADRELAGEHRPAGPDLILEAYRDMVDEVRQSGQPSVRLDPPQVVVAAPDRRGLFSAVAGVLALHGLNVRAANVSGDEAVAVAVEVFTVEVARGTWPDTAKLRQDLSAVLSGELAIAERLTQRETLYERSRRPAAAHLPGSDVGIDNQASDSATVLEVRAPDQVGLLHRLTRALFEADLDVVSARVSTLGDLVVDAFYVREAGGSKVTDPGRLEAITGAVWASLNP